MKELKNDPGDISTIGIGWPIGVFVS